ncbi:crossover junction endodeoxyribonuclease RuvC [Nocardioides salarius]|nr:crossover junction endodeoxyribonuclease RuvC [Nocardioides salarius]
MGIDPSLTGTGWATSLTSYGTLRTKAGQSDRLAVIYDGITAAIVAPSPHLAVVEDLPKHAKGARLTGMVQGVVRLALVNAGVPFVLVPAASLKVLATGKGNADKASMREALAEHLGMAVRDDNQVDALWLRETGRILAGHPDALVLPAQHTRALAKMPSRPRRSQCLQMWTPRMFWFSTTK